MEYSRHARTRMRNCGIDEAEIDNCLSNKHRSYFAGSDVVYVYDNNDGSTLKVRVRGGANPLIVDVFRVHGAT